MSILFYRENFLNKSETFISNYLHEARTNNSMAIDFLCHHIVDDSIKALDLQHENVVKAGFRTNPFVRKAFSVFKSDRYVVAKKKQALAKLTLSKSYKAVHAHFGYEGWMVLDLAKKLQLPLVTTFYGHDISSVPKEEPRWRERYASLFDEGNVFIVEGPYMKKALVALGCPEQKIQILPIAIDLTINRLLNQVTNYATLDQVDVLMIGRFVEKKGFQYGIAAFHELLQTTTRRLRLHVIGGGPEEATLKALVTKRGLQDNVVFHGFLNYKAYQGLLDKIALCVVPSVTASNGETEGGAPTVLLEMQARGIPVVSTFHADIPNVLPAGYPFLAQERDASGLASKIRELIEQTDLSGHIKSSRQFIEERHDVSKSIQHPTQIYTSL